MGAALMTCFLTCSRGPAAAPHAAGGPLLHHTQQVISLGLGVAAGARERELARRVVADRGWRPREVELRRDLVAHRAWTKEEPAPANHVAELGQQERVPLDSMTRQGEVGHRAVQEQLTCMTMGHQPERTLNRPSQFPALSRPLRQGRQRPGPSTEPGPAHDLLTKSVLRRSGLRQAGTTSNLTVAATSGWRRTVAS